MSKILLNLIVLFTLILFISAASSPSCQLSDKTCLKSAAQSLVPVLSAGLPDIGVKILDPAHIDKIKIDLSGLKLSIKDVNITGLSMAVIDKVKVDLNNKTLKVFYHSDMLVIGNYKASGHLLILPINGDGNIDLDIKNLEIHLSMPFDIIKNADGQNVMDLKNFTVKYDVKDGAQFSLTNLFNGNKELSDGMLTFMNQNWKVITDEFGYPIIYAFHEIIFDSVKKYMATQPINLE